jgi:hypothetical protein
MKELKKISICEKCIHWSTGWDDENETEYEYCNITYDEEKLKYSENCNDFER